MRTNRWLTPGAALLAGSILGLANPAQATEELVVYGAAAQAAAQAEQQQFQTKMQRYLRALNEQLKTTLEEGMRKLPEPKLQLASGETPARG